MPSVFFISLMSAAPWGGSEELWSRTALAAARKGWKVGCAVYHWPGKESKLQSLKAQGASIWYLPNKGRSKKNLLERLQNKISKWKVGKSLTELPVHEYDLVVINMGAFEITLPAWQQYYKQLDNYIVLYHNYRETEIFSGRKKEAIQQLAAHAKLNLVASRRIKEVLLENSDIPMPHAEVLVNPITFDPPAGITPFPDIDQGPVIFCMLAALEINRKSQDQLILALASSRWKERNWILNIYGEGKDRPLLQQMIQQHRLEEKIFLKGHSADVKLVLQQSHLLLQITRQDAMPLSVVEAMALSRPVIVSHVGDMPFWIKEGTNGWLVKEASSAAIDLVLDKAWQQKDQWQAMGKQAYNSFREKYPDSVENALLEKMKQVISEV